MCFFKFQDKSAQPNYWYNQIINILRFFKENYKSMLETLGSNKNKLEILQWKIFLQSAQTQIRLEGAEIDREHCLWIPHSRDWVFLIILFVLFGKYKIFVRLSEAEGSNKFLICFYLTEKTTVSLVINLAQYYWILWSWCRHVYHNGKTRQVFMKDFYLNFISIINLSSGIDF